MARSQRARSYVAISGPDGVEEWNAYTCAHCQAIRRVKAAHDPTEQGGVCRKCMGLLCPRCYTRLMRSGECTIWEKQMEAMERAFARHRAMAEWGLPR